MARCSKMFTALIVVGFLVSSAVAAPVTLTGNPDPADYEIIINDAANEAGLAEHLDADQLMLAGDDTANLYYLALTVNDPDISRVGGPTSFFYTTVLDCRFLGTGGTVLHDLTVILTADDVIGLVDNAPLAPAQFTAVVDSGLEVAISQDALPCMAGVDTFDLLAQLDDTGAAADDQIAAFGIPEPATFGLLTLGGLVTLARRRR